jgi:CRP/FNR family transcriptional regulator, anaerobic regulatory protein
VTELEQYINSYFGVIGEEMTMIASLFKRYTLKRGEFYVTSGIPSDKLCFIESGYLRLYATVGEKEITQWIGSKGTPLGDMAGFMFNTPARWNIQALVDTDIHTIQKEDYIKISETIPRWPEIEKYYMINSFIMMEGRIFTHLSMSSEERYVHFYNLNKELFNQVPLQYIASMLGMTPETFSRIRKKLLF